MESAVPARLENSARYWCPLSVVCAVKLKVVLVAPLMLFHPDPVFTCHCTVGAGYPFAAAEKVAVSPAFTVWLVGLVVTLGACWTVRVAALLVAVWEVPPKVLVKTAWYWFPSSVVWAVKV